MHFLVALSEEKNRETKAETKAETKSETQTIFLVNGNSKGAPLRWRAETEQDWIAIQMKEGVTPTNISVHCEVKGLKEGKHQGLVRFSAENAIPQTLAVFLTITPTEKPKESKDFIRVFPALFHFVVLPHEQIPESHELLIQSKCADGVAWSIICDSDWIEVNPTSGFTIPSVGETVGIRIHADSLKPGTHWTVLKIFAQMETAIKKDPILISIVVTVPEISMESQPSKLIDYVVALDLDLSKNFANDSTIALERAHIARELLKKLNNLDYH